MANRQKLSKRTTQLLIFGWAGMMLVVGACVFLGVWFALNRGFERAVVEPTETAAAQGADIEVPTATPLVQEEPAEPVETEIEPTIPPREDDSFGYGIQARLELVTEDTLNRVEELGMNWVKQQLRWADLEPVQGEANWDVLADIFGAASQRGVRVMVNVVAAPEWASSPASGEGDRPPADPATYAAYVGELASRHSGQIHAIEIWNEPNLRREWVTDRPLSSQEYMELLIPAVEAIREADPNIIIISAALAPTGVNDGNNAINDVQYLQELIDAGLLDYVDCVGAHHNGYNIPPDVAYDAGFTDASAVFQGPFANPHPSWSFYSTLRGYRDVIVASGYDTPLCVTEFGWPSVEGMEGEPRESFEFAYDNSLEEQAEHIVAAYQQMYDWGFVWLAFLFNLDYSPKAGGNTQDDTTLYSILNPAGEPRPAYDAVRDMPKPP
ncbi:MAG: glycoside hydrolase family 5 protein [Chloroflexi bacterium]|nr:glycoside hydrolase family 5 protein [Chloroflexota bacterium]